MKEITQFENLELEIWRRPRQRHMNLRVRPDGALRVTCNLRRSRREIMAFIQENREFIFRRLREMEAMDRLHPRKNYDSGEEFLWLGQPRQLDVIWSWVPKPVVRGLTDEGQKLEMVSPLTVSREARREAMHRFFQQQAHAFIKPRVQYWAGVMSLFPKSVTIRGQQTLWGSCSSRGIINLNWKLMAAPERVIDYVIVHEVAHLKHMNHSSAFWSLVSAFQPDWNESKAWLRKMEPRLAVQFL